MTTVDPTPTTAPSRNWLTTLLLAILALVIVGVMAFLFQRSEEAAATPADNSAEAGFARDMILHHTQAVEMARLLYDRADNPDLKSIGLDMLLTQQAQVGQMQGWLALWEIPYARQEVPMAWMEMPVNEGLMPGMATDEQLNELREAEGEAAERLFINLMIPHHESGIHMAEAVLSRTEIPAVRQLAEAIISSQAREIAELQHILDHMDGTAAPHDENEGDHDHADGTPEADASAESTDSADDSHDH